MAQVWVCSTLAMHNHHRSKSNKSNMLHGKLAFLCNLVCRHGKHCLALGFNSGQYSSLPKQICAQVHTMALALHAISGLFAALQHPSHTPLPWSCVSCSAMQQSSLAMA